jgi:hypothetical protein
MADAKIPDWKLERYLLNELSPEQARELRAMLDSDPASRRRLRALEKSNRALLEEYPAEMMAARIEEEFSRRRRAGGRARKPASLYRRFMIPALALTTAAVVIFLVKPLEIGHYTGLRDAGTDVTRIKGMQTGLYIYRKSARGPEELRDGSTARANDLLQLAYVSTDNLFGAILSIDGRGVVTIHYPPQGRVAARLELNKKVLLSSAYQLDDAPGFERFFYVSSKRPLLMKEITEAAERLAKNQEYSRTAPLDLNDDIQQLSIVIKKSNEQ